MPTFRGSLMHHRIPARPVALERWAEPVRQHREPLQVAETINGRARFHVDATTAEAAGHGLHKIQLSCTDTQLHERTKHDVGRNWNDCLLAYYLITTGELESYRHFA